MTLTKLQKNSILISLLIVAAAFLFCSCGSRKVNKSETQISETARTETKTVDSSKTVTKSDTNTKIIDSSSTDEFTIAPIDSTAKMIVDGKSYFNAILKHKKTKSNTVAEIKNTIEQATQKAVKTDTKAESVKVTKAKSKNIVAEHGFPWWILILISILLCLVYYLYRRYKGLSLV